MRLTGQNFIGSQNSQDGAGTFKAVNPTSGEQIDPPFQEATEAAVDHALQLADKAFQRYRQVQPGERAAFLKNIAEALETLGEALLERASAETGLGLERLRGERGRTVGQLRMFADLLEEGSWVDARIDRAQPERKPLPRADLRRMLIPLGPVVVFGASNFPLAFSVAGGDTASALAAGCPVVKGHPAHPGTSELVGRAILEAAEKSGMPEGVFSLLQGAGHEVGLQLVRHPKTKAVGFTGSLRGGRALYDAATSRPEPIPVYAEMGSINPVFVLPGAMKERGDQIAEGLAQSVLLGVGQFCTNPGLVVSLEDEPAQGFIQRTAQRITESAPATMLYAGICQTFTRTVERLERSGVAVAGRSSVAPDPGRTEAGAVVFATDAQTFMSNQDLSEEVFGPATIIVRGRAQEDLLAIANGLEGHLTATVHGTEADLETYRELITVLELKVGRLLFNGYPTGVEVAPAMHHGGPYPATTDARSTSVGTAAIHRFVRPICYQNAPQSLLPPELQDGNPRGIWRLVDNQWTKEGQ
jgi:alpha-ketoglutaric semialdehyde dehydrogenase